MNQRLLDQSVLKRLAFVRYLYRLGVTQSHKPPPLNAWSILAFHDSLEFFLFIGSEFHGLSSDDISLLRYWEEFSSKARIELTQEKAIQRLSRARAALKHRGTLVSSLDVESFRATTTSFFEENCQDIFGVAFEKVSLLEIVTLGIVRSRLRSAEDLITNGEDPSKAIREIAIAFDELLRDYAKVQWTSLPDSTSRARASSSPVFGASLHPTASMYQGSHDDLYKTVEEIRRGLEMVSLGLNYERYWRLKQIWPAVHWPLGRPDPVVVTAALTPTPTLELCRESLDFVVESALHLQERRISSDSEDLSDHL